MINSKTLFLAVLIVIPSCNSQNSALKSPNLKAKFDSLQKEYIILAYKNDSLRKALNIIKKEFGLDKQVTDESDNLLSKYKLALTRVKTGYVVSNYETLFLPSITVEIKNLSQNDLRESITFKAIFIDNSNGEQLSNEIKWFCSSSSPFLGGLTSQFTLSSSIGWTAIINQNVSVRLYLNDELIKQYKVAKEEYFGRI